MSTFRFEEIEIKLWQLSSEFRHDGVCHEIFTFHLQHDRVLVLATRKFKIFK